MQDEARKQLNFSMDEWEIIVGICSWRGSVENRIGWYSSILGPIVLFCVYGVWVGEMKAVGLAFACLLACKIWLIIVELRNIRVYRSICSKIISLTETQKPIGDPECSP